MENLTLEELKTLEKWYEARMREFYAGMFPENDLLYEKVKQAIADKEFEEKSKPLNF